MSRWLLALAALLLSPVALAQDLARETAQVEDLRSIREIKRLQALWGHNALAGEWQAMAGLGTDDVRMVLPDGDAVGRASLEAWLRDRMGQGADGIPAGRLNLRLWFSPVITLAPDGQSATGRWHQVALLGEEGASAEWLGTTDVVQYRKTAAGWRIAHIRPYRYFAGPYAGGWKHDAATLERAPYHYSPDQAGQLLPDRVAARPRSRDELDREATLLLLQSQAQNVFNAYGYYLDRGMYDDVADLFAPDAVIEVAGQGKWSGPEGVRRYLGRFGQPGLDEGELNDRPLLMPLASISADGSSGLIRAVELGMTGQHGGDGFWSAGIQSVLLRRGEDGVWRIGLLHFSPIMRADYRRGWADPLLAALPIGESLWPDGQTELPDISYPHRAMTLRPFGSDLLMAARATEPIAPQRDALRLAEAYDAVENVANAYGESINQFAWRDMAALFAADGWRELPFIGMLAGREKILEGALLRYGDSGSGPRRDFQAIHMLTQPYVTVAPDGARAQLRTRLLQFNSSSAGPGSWIAGVYEKQLVKEAGVWKIAGMDLDYTWMANYQGGWTAADPRAAEALRPTPELLARYAIDAPIRGDPGIPFPRIESLPFHYRNPVSGRAPARLIPWTDIEAKETN